TEGRDVAGIGTARTSCTGISAGPRPFQSKCACYHRQVWRRDSPFRSWGRRESNRRGGGFRLAFGRAGPLCSRATALTFAAVACFSLFSFSALCAPDCQSSGGGAFIHQALVGATRHQFASGVAPSTTRR